MLFSPVISYRILLIEGREVPSLRSKIKAVAGAAGHSQQLLQLKG